MRWLLIPWWVAAERLWRRCKAGSRYTRVFGKPASVNSAAALVDYVARGSHDGETTVAVVQSAKDADLLVTIRTSGEAASRTRYDAVRATILFCHGRVPPFGSFDNLVRAVFPSGLVDSDPFDALADGWELYQLERHADAPGRS